MMSEDFFGQSDIFLFDSVNEQSQAKEKKKKKKGKSKKVEYQTAMQKCPKSPFKCKTHNSEFLRLKEPVKNPPNCKSCGIKLDGQKGYLSCPKSANCFNICSVCKICPQNHILIHCVSLRQYEGQLYSQNKFKCEVTQTEMQVSKDGVYHCHPCDYSISMESMRKFTRLWEEYEVESEVQIIEEEKEEDQ